MNKSNKFSPEVRERAVRMDANDIICGNSAVAPCDVSPNLPTVKAI